MLEISDLTKDHEAMRDERRLEEPAWRDIARIVSPDEQDFDKNSTTDPDAYDVYDSTPLMALEEFAGGMFGESINPAERWMELAIADKDLQKWGPVQGWLYRRASKHLRSLMPSASNFYTEATAWFSNLGRYGNAFQYQEEWVGRGMIIDKSIAAGQAFIRLDPAGHLERFDREWKWTGRQMKAFYGAAAASCDDARQYQLLHAVYPNPDFRPGMLGPRGMMFASTSWSPDDKAFRVDKAYYEMPYHALFWNTRAGKSYARGPGHIARPDMNTLNEMERANLIDAQFAAEPLILTNKEGIFTAADIVPNSVLEGAITEQGKELVKTLQRGDNPQRAENKTDQVRNRVKEAFKFSMMQLINRPQMTATEWMGWKEEKLRTLGPQLVRIQQGLGTYVARRDRILDRAGQFADDPMPPELAGHPIAVEFVSPLAKAQKLAQGRAVLQWIGALGQIAEFTKNPAVMDVVNTDGSARVLHDGMVGMPDVINDQKAVEQIRQARAQQMLEQQKMEQAAQGAGIIADVAHAAKAMSTTGSTTGAGGRPN